MCAYNLIAEKKALPMIVVMPSGWTPSGGQVMTADATKDPFKASRPSTSVCTTSARSATSPS